MPSQPAIVTIGQRIVDDLDRRFAALDTDEDGDIALNELFRLYNSERGVSEAILRFYDVSGDDVIDETEFRKVGLILLSNQKFRVADVDDSGALSWTEFKAALIKMGFGKKFTREMFRRADGDKNGEIDQLEFLDAMLKFITDYDDLVELVGPESDGDDSDSDEPVPIAGGGDDGGVVKGKERNPEPKPPTPPPSLEPSQTLGSKIMEILGAEFDDLDVNGTGFLTADEIKEIPGNKEEAAVLLAYLDLDGDESVSRQEFVQVGLLANVKKLFHKYDVDRSGSLVPEELNRLLRDYLGSTEADAENVFRLADQSGDGKIQEMEFYMAILLHVDAPKDSNQIKLHLNDEIDEDDKEMHFDSEIKVNTESSLLNLHFSVVREIVEGDKTIKRHYKATFPTRVQGKLSDEEEVLDEDDDFPMINYEMDPNFHEESANVTERIDVKYAQPVQMGSNDAIAFTAIVNMVFDKKTPGSNIIMTGTKEVFIPIKIQTLKSAQEQELILTASKVAQLAGIP